MGHLGAISLKNLAKHEEVRKLEKELIRLIVKYLLNLPQIFFPDVSPGYDVRTE